MFDLQGYKDGKRIFYQSNLLWEKAFEYLEVKKDINVDSVDVQLFTDDGKNGMPLDDIEATSIKEAQNWINYVMGKIIKHEYSNVKYYGKE